MGLSILQVARCGIHSMPPNLQSTSLGSFWSRNIYALSNPFGSGFKSKLLGFNSFESPLGGVNRTWILRHITGRAEQRTVDTEISKPILYDAQQKIQESLHIKHLVKVFVIDFETTGFCRESGRIIEIGIRDLRGGENSTFQTLVNPEQHVPNSHVHGITTDMVNQPGVPRMRDLIPILLQYIKSRHEGIVLFVAHNGRNFDIPFLTKEFRRCSEEIPPNWLFLDTLPLARELRKLNGSKLNSRISLHALCEDYGISLSSSDHRAMSDVNMLSAVFERLTFDLKLTIADLLERSFMASDLINLKKNNNKKTKS